MGRWAGEKLTRERGGKLAQGEQTEEARISGGLATVSGSAPQIEDITLGTNTHAHIQILVVSNSTTHSARGRGKRKNVRQRCGVSVQFESMNSPK